MRDKIFIAAIAVILPVMLFGASTGKITGVVKDIETGSPLPGANIMLDGTVYGTATGVEGVYIILNIPPGTYDLSARMIGYKKMIVKNVRISADLTTHQDFILETEVLQGEEVVVEATRPLIQQDVTASRTIQSGEEINAMPVDNYEGAMTIVAGAVVDDGTVHFRGGRTSEIVYLIDNMSMSDPLTGNNDSEISNFAIEEVHIMTGGFSAEYGNAQSGVVNVITKEGGSSFGGRIRYTTSDNSFSRSISRQLTDGEVEENRQRVEFIISGPDPIFSRLLPIPGKINYLFTGDIVQTDGRFLNQQRDEYSVFGKISYRPIPQFIIRVSGLQNLSNFNYFSNLWKRTVYEDRQVKYAFRDDNGDGLNDNNNYIEGWFDNGSLDTEDLGILINNGQYFGAGNGNLDFIDVNGNGEWDPGEPTEDLNGNNVLDMEDLNHNNSVDKFNMLDHLADIELLSNQFSVSISHQLSDRTFYEFTLHRYYTKNWQNPIEVINEDIDGDGKLDMVDEYVLTADGSYIWNDIDGDGYFDRGNEDLNGDNILNQIGVDMYTDYNGNGYVDASEIGPAPREYYERMGDKDPESTWLSWGDIPHQGQKDYDGFYTYGAGTTWDRTGWYLDESYTYGLKFDLESQITLNHSIRTGIDAGYQDIFRYDATDRYGYGENFRVEPTNFAAYIQDKMEFGSVILNIGLRYDYFNANWDNYPNNVDDPTWDRDEQLFVGNEDVNNNAALDPGEDLNGNGFLDQSWIPEKYHKLDGNGDPLYDADALPVYIVYPGEIKDPQKVKSQAFVSPRFGISYPITVNDKMFFSYGRYFSRPMGNLLYRNLEFDMGGGFPVIGNPKLEPEKTSAYEAGVKHAFKSQSTLELKGFFKNVTGLTDSRAIYFTVRDWYAFYYNNDYGSIRGFEMTFTQRPLSLRYLGVGGMMSYTYSVAKNKSSSSFEGYITEWAGDVHPTEETYTDWDQRHTVNFNLDVRTTKRLGTLLGDWRANFLGRYGSGMRWTPPKGQDKAQLDNTEEMPYTFTVDVRISKVFTVGGLNLEFMLDVRNIFNRKNVVDIANEEWYAADQDGNGEPDYDPEGKYDDPSVYSQGRVVRAIFGIDF